MESDSEMMPMEGKCTSSADNFTGSPGSNEMDMMDEEEMYEIEDGHDMDGMDEAYYSEQDVSTNDPLS